MVATWNENDLRNFLKVIGDFHSLFSLSSTRPRWVDPIVRFCLALRSEDLSQAEQIRTESMSMIKHVGDKVQFDADLQKCALFFGAEQDMKLVKYVVEFRRKSRNDLLLYKEWYARSFDADGKSGNVLLFCHGQRTDRHGSILASGVDLLPRESQN